MYFIADIQAQERAMLYQRLNAAVGVGLPPIVATSRWNHSWAMGADPGRTS